MDTQASERTSLKEDSKKNEQKKKRQGYHPISQNIRRFVGLPVGISLFFFYTYSIYNIGIYKGEDIYGQANRDNIKIKILSLSLESGYLTENWVKAFYWFFGLCFYSHFTFFVYSVMQLIGLTVLAALLILTYAGGQEKRFASTLLFTNLKPDSIFEKIVRFSPGLLVFLFCASSVPLFYHIFMIEVKSYTKKSSIEAEKLYFESILYTLGFYQNISYITFAIYFLIGFRKTKNKTETVQQKKEMIKKDEEKDEKDSDVAEKKKNCNPLKIIFIIFKSIHLLLTIPAFLAGGISSVFLPLVLQRNYLNYLLIFLFIFGGLVIDSVRILVYFLEKLIFKVREL